MFSKVLKIVIIAVIAVILTVSSVAQNNKQQKYWVNSFTEISKLGIGAYAGETIEVALRDCKEKNQICSLTISASVDEVSGRSSSGTIVCTITYNNAAGSQIASLTNNQSTTFYKQYGHSPMSWNSLPSPVAAGGVGASWGPILGSVAPSIGIKSGVGFSQLTATLYYFGSGTNRVVNIGFDAKGSPYVCTGA